MILIFVYDMLSPWYFEESSYSDRLVKMQLKPDTIGLSDGNFSKHLCILGSP